MKVCVAQCPNGAWAQIDLAEAKWCLIAPHLPVPKLTDWLREWPKCEIINGVFHVMRPAGHGA